MAWSRGLWGPLTLCAALFIFGTGFPGCTPDVEVAIVSPRDGARIDVGDPLVLQGGAIDTRDRSPIPDARLTWLLDGSHAGQGGNLTLQVVPAGRHKLRLDAERSDGKRGSKEVRIEVVDAVPQVTIAAPANGHSVRVDQGVRFEGSATDREDGAIPATSLEWRSDLDGPLGRGDRVDTAKLRPGSHTVTLSATDSAGGVGRSSVRVTVLNDAPRVSITAPPTWLPLIAGAPLQLAGEATDTEDGAVPGTALRWLLDPPAGQVLGTGDSIWVVAGLPAGRHELVLEATDRHGTAGRASRMVDVQGVTAPPPTGPPPFPVTPPPATSPWESYTSGLWPPDFQAVATDPDGRTLWLGTDGQGLFRFASVQDQDQYRVSNSRLPSDQVRDLVATRRNVWVATAAGVGQFDGASWRVHTRADGLASEDVRALAVERATGRIWAGTGVGLSVYDGNRWSTPAGQPRSVQAPTEVRDLAASAERVWVATNEGLLSYEHALDRWSHYRTWTNPGLVSDDLRAVAVDPLSGAIWVGTSFQGVVRFSSTRWSAYTTADGLPGNHVTALTVDGRGQPWVGTDGRGLGRRESGRWTAYRAASGGLLSDTVRALAVDDNGAVWVGVQGGVSVYRGP